MAGRSFVRHTALTAALLLTLSACGGGGGGGTSATTSSSSASGSSSSSSSSTSSAASSAATLDANTIAPLTDDVFIAAQFISVETANIPGITGTSSGSETLPGPGGGQVSISLQLDASGNGILTDVFTSYVAAAGSASISGTVTVSYSNFKPKQLQFQNVRAIWNKETFHYDGTLYVNSTSPLAVTADISITSSRASVLLTNFTSRQAGSGTLTEFPVAISGKLTDSGLGSVKIATLAPVYLKLYPDTSAPFPDVFPQGSYGEVTLSGANGETLHVTPLNSLLVGLTLEDSTARLTGARLDRSSGGLDVDVVDDRTIEAVAELGSDVNSHGSTVVDGRYSHSTAGLVSYHWQLVTAPAGSQATFDETTPVAYFQPDVDGGYVLSLTVNDGLHSAVDYVEFDYPDRMTGDAATKVTRFKTPSFLSVPVGVAVTLDGRSSPDTTDGTWLLKTPDGSVAALSSSTDPEPDFTPDVPGTYVATYCESANVGCQDPAKNVSGTTYSDVTVIEAGIPSPVRFGPMTPIASLPSGFSPSDSAADDFAGSGRDSLALVGYDTTAGSQEMVTVPASATAPGGFAASQTTTLPSTATYLGDWGRFGDINGDGIPDWAVDSPTNGITTYLSGSGGYTTASINDDGSFAIGTVANKQALVLLDTPSISSLVNIQPAAYLFDNSSGAFGSAILSTAIAPVSRVYESAGEELGDFDGDKVTDLAATYANMLSADSLRIFKGNGDGTFTLSESFNLDSSANGYHPIKVADVLGNGNLDLIVADTGGWHIFAGDGAGNFTDAGVIASQCDVFDCSLASFNTNAAPALVGAPSSCAGVNCQDVVFFMHPAGSLSGNWYSYPTKTYSTVHTGDYNNDGIPDLYLDDGSTVYVMPGLNADGSLP